MPRSRSFCRPPRAFRLTVVHMREEARKRGGTFLSPHYKTAPSLLEWKCGRGHVFELVGHQVRNAGMWCPECPDLERLERLQALAAQHGGRLLSPNYRGDDFKHEWRCAMGHTWRTRPQQILKGSWCPRCAGNLPHGLQRIRRIARERGGEFLGTKYGKGKLPFRCGEGHEWNAAGAAIARGTWCPVCAGNRPIGLERIRAIARKRGGECRSDVYRPRPHKLEFRCAKGHVWRATGNDVAMGRWCARCAGNVPLTLRQIQELARSRGGACLSKRYRPGPATRLRWRCAKGHVWSANPVQVRYETWCPVCAGNVLTLDMLRDVARERGGRLLSSRYRGGRVKLRWRCAKGHEWSAAPVPVKHGTWCPACGGRKPLTLAMMQRAAAKHGGQCLSREYSNIKKPLSWRCYAGHVWSVPPSQILHRRYWCAVCAKEERQRKRLEQ